MVAELPRRQQEDNHGSGQLAAVVGCWTMGELTVSAGPQVEK